MRVLADPKHAIVVDKLKASHSDSHVRARAVMEVTSSQAFDAMGTPLPRGLYDPRLGPYDSFGASKPCPTCGCLYASCPGHSGV
eukprot:CAMPEP_0202468828 /NCGR_PEP_ID=MMETSP1360-20130828/76603_1 /ASSEMBLY_ACC=CAM_ASM_000848 /TAXON_ID=515479 /ORGANISM="Licmophora paradoxa, Strain CCMP2313" /LENGTH=83 /DNA_ID=CAMNT_0049093933 /DNA_START=46 /DNA_END=294 /DNA_ORIENTATION=+